MACTASKTPLLRMVAARGFATQAHPRVNSPNHADVRVTTLPNKLVVASVDANSPITRVSIAFRAGSREETYENLGVGHTLRISAGLTNKRSTVFGVMRNVQATGGSISATNGRETITYNVTLKRDSLETGLKFLQDISVEQIFNPWELVLQTGRIQLDLARVPADVRAVDLLHRAAFRTELGNSTICPKHHVGKISSECLQHFVAKNFTANRAAVVGVGIDHDFLVGYAKNLHLEGSTGENSVASKFFGGELRVDKAGQLASVAVGTQGAALSNQKEALAFAILRNAAGTGPSVRRGGVNGALGKVVSSSLSSPFVFSALNESYTDNGLFGFVLTGNAREIGKAVQDAIKALKTGSVSSADVARGKEQLKVSVLHSLDSTAGLFENIKTQALLTGRVETAAELVAAIDAVSDADVNAAAKKVASGKWAVGAVGNLVSLPYVTEL